MSNSNPFKRKDSKEVKNQLRAVYLEDAKAHGYDLGYQAAEAKQDTAYEYWRDRHEALSIEYNQLSSRYDALLRQAPVTPAEIKYQPMLILSTDPVVREVRAFGTARINAIKFVRDRYKIGLLHAKQFVEACYYMKPEPAEMDRLHEEALRENKSGGVHSCTNCRNIFYCDGATGGDCSRGTWNPHPLLCGRTSCDYDGLWRAYNIRKKEGR